MITIGIVGNGFVGQATQLLEGPDIQVLAYDLDQSLCSPPGTTLQSLRECDLVFISVPTPMSKTGACHVHILESVVWQLREIRQDISIVIRSTVPPGTCDRLGCSFMPEFLTEKNFREDFRTCRDWIFGVPVGPGQGHTRIKLEKLIRTAYDQCSITSNRMHFVSPRSAEVVKYARNTFLAVKVSYFNEIYRMCESQGIPYSEVRRLTALDTRIGESHTQCPGHDGRFGYGGTCFPKDVAALIYEFGEEGVECPVLEASHQRNTELDRPERDWEADVGRAVIG